MRKLISIFLMSMLLIQSGFVNGQDRRTVDTKIADALAKMQTKNLDELNTQLAYVIETKEEGVNKLLNMLEPASKSSTDTEVRMALGSLALYVSQDGHEADRAWIAKAYASFPSKGDEVDAFLLQQLKFIAGDNEVDLIAKKLDNKYLCADAAMALVAINSAKSEKALVSALENGVGNDVDLVNALYELGAKNSTSALINKLNTTTEAQTKSLINKALSQTASADAVKALQNQVAKAKYMPEPTGAVSSYLALADRSAKSGNDTQANAIIYEVLKKCTKDENQNFKLQALSILADNYGYLAMPKLLDAFDSDDKKFRGGVLEIAEDIKDVGAVKQWIDKAKSSDNERKSEILYMLSRLKCPSASAYIRSEFNNPNADVKQAAIKSLALIDGGSANTDLVDLFYKSTDEKTQSAVKDALEITSDKRNLKQLYNKYHSLSNDKKVIALNLFGSKSASDYFDLVKSETRSKDENVRNAAYSALSNVSSPCKKNELLSVLADASDNNIKAVQNAIVKVTNEQQDGSNKTSDLTKYADLGSKNKQLILPVVASLGGAEALGYVDSVYKNGNATDKAAAFDAILSWKGQEVVYKLLDICKNGSANDKNKAFNQYVKIARSGSVTPEQKLLLAQDIYPLCSSADDKKAVIKLLGSTRTYPNVIFLGRLLDDSSVASVAANAIMTAALPSDDSDGVYGEGVKEILEKAKDKIAGEDSNYHKINIQKYIDNIKDGGYVSIFNGKDLSGWKGLLENPIKRSKMTPEELSEKQQKADEKMLNFWSVQDNCIVFENGAWDNLCTKKMYGDFEMWVDWWISADGDSGIYLRGSPQVQIWDPARVEVGAQVGSGGLYNNQKHKSTPMLKADNPVEQWNNFYIKMIGDKVTVKINGVLVVDNVVLENYWDRKLPIFPREAIELQAHQTFTKFRNIYVNDLSNVEYKVSDEEAAEGFKPLFNGVNLDGWQGNTTAHKVESEGRLVYYPDIASGNLFTTKEYDNFVLKFDFKLTPGANNGLGVRMPAKGDAAYVGMELQILDNTASIYSKLAEYQYHGSVYGTIAAMRGFLKPVGEWNSEEVYLDGDNIKIVLNGTTILEGNIKEASKNGTLDHKDHPGLKRTSGHIGFLSHGSHVEFRKLRIKELD
ncbi:MAG: DUF1080 domain-containing protein [Bacteroidales bacterium]